MRRFVTPAGAVVGTTVMTVKLVWYSGDIKNCNETKVNVPVNVPVNVNVPVTINNNQPSNLAPQSTPTPVRAPESAPTPPAATARLVLWVTLAMFGVGLIAIAAATP